MASIIVNITIDSNLNYQLIFVNHKIKIATLMKSSGFLVLFCTEVIRSYLNDSAGNN